MIGDLLTDPDAVIAKARENIARWLPQQRGDGMTARYLLERIYAMPDGVQQTVLDRMIGWVEAVRQQRT